MINIEEIKGTLPAANIKSIVLQDPSSINSASMVVKIKASAITTANELGSEESSSSAFLSVPGLNYNSHLGIALIQSTSQTLTSLLRGFGTDLLKYIGPTNEWKGNGIFDSLLKSAIENDSSYSGDTSSFKSEFMSIQQKPIFGDIQSPIVEKIDNDGRKISTVPFDFQYSLKDSKPKHLTYFILSFLDLAGMISEISSDESPDGGLGINLADLENIAGFSSQVKNDTVFNSGVLSGRTYFFQLPNGNFWTGPVVNVAGQYETDTEIPLTVKDVQNVKIQDFRSLRRLQKVSVMSDFTSENDFTLSRLANIQPRIRELQPSRNKKHPYISDLYSSISAGDKNVVKMMFMVNFEDMLFSNSLYGDLWKTQYSDLRKEIVESSKIKSIKVFREQVERSKGTNSIGSPAERYDVVENSIPVLVASSGQQEQSLEVAEVPNMREDVDLSVSEKLPVRSFSVTDNTIPKTSIGKYRYYVEFDISDGSVNFLRRKSEELRSFLNTLQNYNSDVINSSLRDDVVSFENPHIVDQADDLTRKDGYDPRYGRLSQDFSKKLYTKYYKQDISTGITNFFKTVSLFSSTEIIGQPTDEDGDGTIASSKTFMEMILSPSQTSPEAISSVEQVVGSVLDKINSFIGQDASDPSNLKSESLSGKSSNTGLFITKHFSNVLDLNLYNVGGYDYISPNMNTSLGGSQNTGLKSFGGEAFRNRARLETLKYYNVTNPDLTNGLSSAGEKLYAGNVSAGLSEFGYFSPSQVFSGNRMPVDLLNSNSSNNAMAKVLESEISRKFREYKLGNIPVDSSGEFKKNLEKADQDIDFAPSQQIFNLQRDSNLVLSTKKDEAPNSDQVLTESSQPGATSVGDGEYVFDLGSQNSSHPATLYQSLFQKRGNLPETPISKYDLNNSNNLLSTINQANVRLLPNQIKSIFVSNTGGKGQTDVREPNVEKNDILNDPDFSSSSSFKYRMLAEIQCLVGFDKLEGRTSLASPRWVTLDQEVFSSFVDKNILCRIVKYNAPSGFGLSKQKDLDIGIYDEYFILTPDTQVAASTSFTEENTTSFVGRSSSSGFSNVIRNGFNFFPEAGHTRPPAAPVKVENPVVRNQFPDLKGFSAKIKENPVLDAFHSNPRGDTKSSSSPTFSSSGMNSKTAILENNRQQIKSELSKVNRDITSLNSQILSSEREKAQLTFNANSSNVSDSQRAAATAALPVVNSNITSLNEASKISVEKKASLEASLAETEKEISKVQQSPVGKSYIEVDNKDSVIQTGEASMSYSSTEQLVSGYNSLVAEMEKDAQSGIVDMDKVKEMEKYAGYISGPESNVAEFEKNIEQLKIQSQQATIQENRLIQNSDDLQRTKVSVKTGGSGK